MKMNNLCAGVVFLSTGMFFMSSLSFADQVVKNPDQRIQAREQKQEKEIQMGVQNGSLTSEQAIQLEGQQENIKAEEAKALQSGKISKKEARKIGKMQNRAERNIKKKEGRSGHHVAPGHPVVAPAPVEVQQK